VVRARRWLRFGRALGSLVPFLAGLLTGYALPFPEHLGAWAIVAVFAEFGAVFLLASVVHELGHVVAIRLAGRRPTAVHLLGPPDRVAFHIGALRVGLGISRPGSQVEYPGDGLSVRQDAVIAAAGPAANLVVAPLVLLLPITRWAAVFFAVIMAADGLANLIPAETADGSLSDGVVLLRARARSLATADIRELLAVPDWSRRPDAASRLINGWVLKVPEALRCLKQLPDDRDTLLRLYAQDWPRKQWPQTEFLNIMHALSWKVVARPGGSARLADLAASRVEWVLGQVGKRGEKVRPRPRDVRQTLAVIRLRQGRPAEVGRLCADALAADLDRDVRATVLATVAMAKYQQSLPASARQALHEALALDPSAALVAEAASMLHSDAMSLAATATATPAAEITLGLAGDVR
jgi:hypothetical protein